MNALPSLVRSSMTLSARGKVFGTPGHPFIMPLLLGLTVILKGSGAILSANGKRLVINRFVYYGGGVTAGKVLISGANCSFYCESMK